MPINKTLWRAAGYEPFGAQERFHASPARFKVPAAGRRFGKSRMAAAEVEPYIFDLAMKGPGWIVAPTYENADEFQYLWEDIVVRMNLGNKIKKSNNVKAGDMKMVFPWGSSVVAKSAQHPHTLVGKGLRWVILSEAAKLPINVWTKYIRPALADHKAPAIMPSTPEGFNWYKTEAYDRGQNPRDLEWESWNFPSWENPYVYPRGFDDPEIQSQKRTPDDPFFWQEIGADFRTLAGRVYREWNDKTHIRPHEFDPSLPNYLFFDFGYTNPFVALDVQITPSDEIRVWREYYDRGKPVHVHAQELKARESPPGYRIDGGYGDSADPSAVDTLGATLCPMVALGEAKDVKSGIMEVKKFLAPEPRLFVDPSCENTIHEFNHYQMKEAMRSQAEDAKDEPKKKFDHAMDALRYGVMHIYQLGAGTGSLSELEELFRGEEARGIFTWSGDSITLGESSW